MDGGFLHVGTHDGVTRADVLATHSELASEIDQQAARQAIVELEGKIPGLSDDEISRIERQELQKALTRIKLVGWAPAPSGRVSIG